MTYQPSHRTAAKQPQPQMDAAEDAALMIDDELDDLLDQHVAAIRESLAERLF